MPKTAFAEESKGKLNYDDKVVIDGDQIRENTECIGNISDLNVLLEDGENAPLDCVKAILKVNEKINSSADIIYNPKTDYIELHYLGDKRNIIRGGFSIWNVFYQGVLDSKVKLHTGGDSNISASISGNTYVFSPPALKTGIGTENYYSFEIDVSAWSTLTVFARKEKEGGYLPNVSFGLSKTATTTPNIQIKSLSATTQSFTFNLTGLSDVYYLTFVTAQWNAADSQKCYCFQIQLS